MDNKEGILETSYRIAGTSKKPWRATPAQSAATLLYSQYPGKLWALYNALCGSAQQVLAFSYF